MLRLAKMLQLRLCRDAEFTFCAKRIVLSKKTIQISQPKASRDLALFEVSAERKKEQESELKPEETSLYRSVGGSLSWLATQTRPDFSFRVNQAAQFTTSGTIQHGLLLNRIVKDAEILRCMIFQRGKSLEQMSVLVFGDAAFGNATRGRSQFGVLVVLTCDVQKYLHGDYSTGFLVYWCSSVI